MFFKWLALNVGRFFIPTSSLAICPPSAAQTAPQRCGDKWNFSATSNGTMGCMAVKGRKKKVWEIGAATWRTPSGPFVSGRTKWKAHSQKNTPRHQSMNDKKSISNSIKKRINIIYLLYFSLRTSTIGPSYLHTYHLQPVSNSSCLTFKKGWLITHLLVLKTPQHPFTSTKIVSY